MDLNVKAFKEQFESQTKYRILQGVLRKASINNVSANAKALSKLPFRFNHSLPEKVQVTDQKISGRCWIFAGLNVLRHKLIAHYKLDETFQLSQAYIFKYDKLEKCNTALELMYTLCKKGQTNESLEYATLIPSIIADGGTWPMFCNIVEKYGVVPLEVFPDSAQAANTFQMNNMLSLTIMKASAVIKSNMPSNRFREYKQTILQECHRIIGICLGSEPDKFVWEKKEDKEYSAIEFYEKVVKNCINIADYVYICNYPLEKYNQHLAIEYLHNVLKSVDNDLQKKITNLYMNVPIHVFKKAVAHTISEKKSAVWFACDFAQFQVNRGSILDQNSSNLKEMFDISFTLSKKASLETRSNMPNHAMCFIGYHQTDKKIERWKVENSHGERGDLDGFITMSDSWFDQYVICAAVHKDTLPESLKQNKAQVKWLPFYSPLGIFAL
jgi:bleomycin hydrolase